MKIGVLALQGAFAEHIATLEKLKTEAIPVRLPHQLEGLDGLIIPGGESTTITKLMVHYKLKNKIIAKVSKNLGEAMPGLSAKQIPPDQLMAGRGW